MTAAKCVLPPSSSLPLWPKAKNLTESEIFSLLNGLADVFCPLVFQIATGKSNTSSLTPDHLVDSGYTSETEDNTCHEGTCVTQIDALRNDAFESNFAERWLTSLIARVDDLSCFDSEDRRQEAVDKAYCIVEAIHRRVAYPTNEPDMDDHTYARDFTFKLSLPSTAHENQKSISVRLNDGLSGLHPDDPYDVGLQSWGASIVISSLLCENPARFGLTEELLHCSNRPQIIELGAGTGLVSLVLAQLLPLLGVSDPIIMATDYHEAVLHNLHANIAINFPDSNPPPVETRLMDWSAPDVGLKADMLIATDVVYAWEHAVKLRDCAAQILGPDGVFWLAATVRQNGGFEGLIETVEAAFSSDDSLEDHLGRRLRIMQVEDLEKSQGVGRGDESGYKVFRIRWS